jgi:hypothetical protein
MIRMRKLVKIALIVAAPIALLNAMPTFAIDVGLPPDANWFQQFIASEWVIMHWPGLWLTHFDPYDHFKALDYSAVVLSGYIEWALLLFAGFYAFVGLRSLAREFSAAQG